MAKHAHNELIREDDDHEAAPDRTTPQGTQLHGVENGHEERDVNFPPLLRYIAGLVITIVVSILVTFGVYRLMLYTEKQGEKTLPPAYTMKEAPPLPRLLPNPIDTPGMPDSPEWRMRRHALLVGPGDYGQEELANQRKQLAALGLFDNETGLAVVPDAAVSSLPGATPGPAAADNAPPEPGVREMMPADGSGGLTMENRLR
ncbi:MAG: hypothetical protein K0Q72_2549 [Armatimonadetes bacterium]|jgi:hypothetical protein|nr:hypothetical protein [Armatimonadota bacterium]